MFIPKIIKKIISFPYQLVHSFRRVLYDLKIIKRKKLDAFVISIGNISFGGTGKTPFTISLAEKLLDAGLSVGILTRGYGSKKKPNYPVVLSTSLKPLDEGLVVDEIGDEAFLIYQSLKDKGVLVSVDPNRYRAGLYSLKLEKIDVFILDDGLQHLALHRDLDILIKNSRESGFYREFPTVERRVDYVFYTKVSPDFKNEHPDKNTIQYKIKLRKEADFNRGFYVFTAIGDPNSFFELIKSHLVGLSENSKPIKEMRFKSFRDHHYLSQAEVRELLSSGMNLVCTAKDFVKIPPMYEDLVNPVDLLLDIDSSVMEDIVGRVKYARTNIS